MSVAALETPVERSAGRASARRPHRRRPWELAVIGAIVAVFLYAPIVVVVLFSFNGTRSLSSFGSPGLHWWTVMIEDGQLWASVLVSLQIAVIAALGSLVIGTALAIGLDRLRGRAGAGGSALLSLTLITPEVALGFSLLLVLTSLGVPLSTWTVTAGHITFCLAYVTLVVRARLALLPADVEEAAMDLGASRWQTLWLVVLPQLWPALAGAGLLAFVLSFDDFVVSLFTSGIGTSPLPVRIYSMIRFGVTPEINAIATLTMVVSIVVGLAAVLLAGRAGSPRTRGEQAAAISLPATGGTPHR